MKIFSNTTNKMELDSCKTQIIYICIYLKCNDFLLDRWFDEALGFWTNETKESYELAQVHHYSFIKSNSPFIH